MTRHSPVRLTRSERQRMVSPVMAAVIAFRMHRGRETHYHDLAYHLMLAHQIVSHVQRHEHLTIDTQAGLNALNSVFDRWRQRTVRDGYISATDAEIDALDLAAEIYAAVLKTTPWKTVRRAMLRLNDAIISSEELI